MPCGCWRTTCKAGGALLALALGVGVAGAAPAHVEIAGRYRHQPPVAATLEVRREGSDYAVRLEGGASEEQGAAAPADCVIEAHGHLDNGVLTARFGPVATEDFAYSAADAQREGRGLRITFAPGSAEVLEADSLGYCGLGADFTGSYQAVP